MYIAGLKLPLSPPQCLEVLVVLSTADYVRYIIAAVKVLSKSKGGRIRPESMPPTLMGRIISPIHGLAIFIPPLVYVGALVFNGFQQPAWFARFTLSSEMMESTWGSALRVAACVASFALRSLTDSTSKHLGDQWHVIGVGVEVTVISFVLIFCNSVAKSPGLSRLVRMRGFAIQDIGKLLSDAVSCLEDKHTVARYSYSRRCGLSCSGRTYLSWPLVRQHPHLLSRCQSRYFSPFDIQSQLTDGICRRA